jgi:ankyrin repeat protein
MASKFIIEYGYSNLAKVTEIAGTHPNDSLQMLRFSIENTILYGHMSILKRLPLNVDPGNYFSYIRDAINYDQSRIVEYLLELFGTEFRDAHLDKLLTRLAYKGNLTIIKALHITRPDVNLNKALISAISNKHFKTIKYLVDSGADVNYQIDERNNVLNEAVEVGDLKIVKYLVSRGVDLNNINNDDILCSSFGPNTEQIIDYLVSLDFKLTDNVMNFAIEVHNVEKIKILVSRGLNLNNHHINHRHMCLNTPEANETLKYLLDHAQYTELTLSTILESNLKENFLTVDMLQLLMEHGAELPDRFNLGAKKYDIQLLQFIIHEKPSLASCLNKKQLKDIAQLSTSSSDQPMDL